MFALFAPLVVALLAEPAAHAGSLEVVPTRARGMGGALRGAAAGSAGPTLNPSGISLTRSYVIEGAYHHLQGEGAHLAQLTFADSTSGSNIGGGLTYTYANGKVGDVASSRHEFGLGLAFPLGDYVAIGAHGRYLRLRTETAAGTERRAALTVDVGATVRAGQRVQLGLVSYGLRDLKHAQAPFAFGGGLAVTPIDELLIAADLVVDPRTYLPGAGRVLTYMGGAEYTWSSRISVRAGGGRDGGTGRGYGTLGASALGEMGALDLGARLDFSGEDPLYIGAALRFFVPSP